MAIDVNIPSQVKNYANLAAFPATGSLKTIFIAEDTNKTYRWTGSAYVEISATAASTWGTITGTLSSQTDLNTALSGKVPTSRTLTINGTTQDLSADRTFTISSGITIGTTAITSGTVGRVLFEGAGNVVQESANLFWDNTNGRLGIGTSSPLQSLDIVTSSITSYPRIRTTSTASNTDVGLRFQDGTTGTGNGDGLYIGRASAINYLWTYEAEPLAFGANNLERMRIVNTGNVLINTTTDAGFKLDVNGTARVQDNLTISKNQNLSTRITLSNTTSGNLSQSIYEATSSNGTAQFGKTSASFSTFKILTANDAYFYNGTSGDISLLNDFATGRIKFGAGASSTAQATLFSTGNFAINTTTDAGFKLDVNGTARFSGTNYQVVLQTTSNGIIKAQGGYQNTDGSYTADGNLFLKAGIGGSGNLYITPNNGNTTAFGLFANGTGFNIGLGLSTVASASFQINSTTQGFLPPRMTTTQKNAIATPATGLMVYDNVLNRPCFYDGTTWITL